VPRIRRTVVTDDYCCASVAAGSLDEGEAQVLAGVFAALADPVRLRLLNILTGAEAGEACVCDLTSLVGKSQPTVSHHLKVLADAGLVTGSKRGRWVWYRTEPDQLAALGSALQPEASPARVAPS
jgi:ArsR family transcriptional regulator, arsenate/arsenite/antimonite-responsive transcriptional repressor